MQNKDYDRTICNECSLKEICKEYRNRFWCKDCQFSLKCLVKDVSHTANCPKKRQLWQKLPCNCLLLDKLLRELEQGKDNFIKSPAWVCPRCLHNTAIIFTETQKENRYGDKVHYTGWCFVCGVRSHEEGL